MAISYCNCPGEIPQGGSTGCPGLQAVDDNAGEFECGTSGTFDPTTNDDVSGCVDCAPEFSIVAVSDPAVLLNVAIDPVTGIVTWDVADPAAEGCYTITYRIDCPCDGTSAIANITICVPPKDGGGDCPCDIVGTDLPTPITGEAGDTGSTYDTSTLFAIEGCDEVTYSIDPDGPQHPTDIEFPNQGIDPDTGTLQWDINTTTKGGPYCFTIIAECAPTDDCPDGCSDTAKITIGLVTGGGGDDCCTELTAGTPGDVTITKGETGVTTDISGLITSDCDGDLLYVIDASSAGITNVSVDADGVVTYDGDSTNTDKVDATIDVEVSCDGCSDCDPIIITLNICVLNKDGEIKCILCGRGPEGIPLDDPLIIKACAEVIELCEIAPGVFTDLDGNPKDMSQIWYREVDRPVGPGCTYWGAVDTGDWDGGPWPLAAGTYMIEDCNGDVLADGADYNSAKEMLEGIGTLVWSELNSSGSGHIYELKVDPGVCLKRWPINGVNGRAFATKDCEGCDCDPDCIDGF